MKIGIDIDGVLTDIEQWQLDYGSKYYYEKFQKGIVSPKAYELFEIFGISKEAEHEFWYRNMEEYSTHAEIRMFAAEVIGKLRAEGHEIYIITARGSWVSKFADIMSKEKSHEIVIEWLEKNGVAYDELIFSAEDKVKVCQENGIDVMIDDSPTNVAKISSAGIPVFCFHAGYNEKCEGEKIQRVYSWYDVYGTIEKMAK
ncbi:MAG: hypothetical protein J6M02_06690 [Clostridia bacterium]|nr:hypothetical protein [Clostridia bacterium]